MAAVVDYLEGTEFQKNRAFSPAVITQGGKTVWLAGQTATVDASGNDISGNFEAQVRAIVWLVSSSVAGLAPDRVSVIDQTGALLSARGHACQAVAASRAMRVKLRTRPVAVPVRQAMAIASGAGFSAI